jgi:glycosyltransferase involved in cell wall biosynthesis
MSFASGDAPALAEAMNRMAGLPDAEMERMGRAARAWVERDFTVAVYRERMLEIYGELGLSTAAESKLQATA